MSDALQAQDEAAARHATGPRVTLRGMEERMVRVSYLNAGDAALGDITGQHRDADPLDCLTICIITMQNGFTVVGLSACASPENFNETYGQELTQGEDLYPEDGGPIV